MKQDRERFEKTLKQAGNQLGNAIHNLWQNRSEALWSKDPWYFVRLGGIANSLGQNMFAHDVLREGTRLFPADTRLVQLYSLSLVACGFLNAARDLLDGLIKKGHLDEETLGILGRVYKEMWLGEGGGAVGHPHLAKARELYIGAYKRSRGAYSGINAASLSMIMGDAAVAQRLAREVVRACAERWKTPARRDYWTVATLAEGFLLLGRQEKAEKYYRVARARGGRGFANLASTRRQLLLLSRHVTVDPRVLDAVRIPPVVAFTGHMIDPPGRRPAHFPAPAAAEVRKQIAAALEKLDVRIGYASAACGADLLFHECLLDRGGESNVVLPFDRASFLETSVAPGGPGWRLRAERILGKCAVVEQATRGGYCGDDLLFTYANQLILGKAILRSRTMETDPLLVAVWDGRNGKPGGTAECVRLWDNTGYPSITIHPATAKVSERSARRGAPARRVSARRGAIARETAAIIFADMVGYSMLKEEQVPGYVQGLLKVLQDALAKSGTHPMHKDTWGDAACMVFADPLAAAQCALSMRDAVTGTDWEKRGLPRGLSMRIGLHAGPVYRIREPLLDRENFFGFHMNQAARIEPITRPGNVYASEAFASLLVADRRNRFDCRYVGVIVLPKRFGKYPIYHVKRPTDAG
jgi:class 3 adenylate cyclase